MSEGCESQPRLFEYLDYRAYLHDYYRAKKRQQPHFSYRSFSWRAGLSSPSFLLDVIKGKKNITSNSIAGFCQALRHDPQERFYFENLVYFNQATKTEAKHQFYEKILPIFKKECGTLIRECQQRYFSKWYVPVIREMVSLEGFRESPRWICQKLNQAITSFEAQEAIGMLLELGFLRRDDMGRLKINEENIDTPDPIPGSVPLKFHEEMIELAKKSLKGVPVACREISGITAAMTREQFSRLKHYIQELQNKLMNELEDSTGGAEEVYQFNCQLFPLTASDNEDHVR